MPQLKSGRHVAISSIPFLNALESRHAESRYFATLALHHHVTTPDILCANLIVGYFLEGEGTPPYAPMYSSGYRVADVLEGRSDWQPDEVEEFREFLQSPRNQSWLQREFARVADACQNNATWIQEWVDADKQLPDIAHLKREVLAASATRPDALIRILAAEAPPPRDPDTVSSDPDPNMCRLPNELRELILRLARQPDVHSVSCQFWDPKLWHGLLTEQVKRAQQSGKPLQQAYFLCGPDSGIPGVAKNFPDILDLPEQDRYHGDTLEEILQGEIHIPVEGVCGADLFVYPDWRKVYPEHWQDPDAKLDHALAGKPCNHLLIAQDLGECPSAIRTGPYAGQWWLYQSTAPYKDCNPFHQP